MANLMLAIDAPLTQLELDELERLAVAADEQIRMGRKEWPGKPSRQRLELFLAANPDTVLRLVKAARRADHA